jgi:hypothetical protein
MRVEGPVVIFFKGHRFDRAREVLVDCDGAVREFASYEKACEVLRDHPLVDYGEPVQLSLAYRGTIKGGYRL